MFVIVYELHLSWSCCELKAQTVHGWQNGVSLLFASLLSLDTGQTTSGRVRGVGTYYVTLCNCLQSVLSTSFCAGCLLLPAFVSLNTVALLLN